MPSGWVEPDVAFGVQALGLLVVDHPVGFERRAPIVDLHIADRGDALVGIVVVDLLGANEHLLLGRPARRIAAGRCRRLLGRAGGKATSSPWASAGRASTRLRAQATSDAANADGAPAQRGGSALVVDRAGGRHHPSSWYSKRDKPRHATHERQASAAATPAASAGLAQIPGDLGQDVEQKARPRRRQAPSSARRPSGRTAG